MTLLGLLGNLTTAAGRTALLAPPFTGLWGRPVGTSIRRAVIAALRQNLDLAAIVGDRIHDRFVPEDVQHRPCLVCSLESIQRPRSLGGADGTATARFRFETITPLDASSTAGEAGESVAEILRLRFDGLVNTTLPGPVAILEAWSDDDVDVYQDAGDDGEPILITGCEYVFRYREQIPTH
jgi:hypothetical protein